MCECMAKSKDCTVSIFLAGTKQFSECFCPSVCPSVYLSICYTFHIVPLIQSSSNCQELLPMREVMSRQEVKVIGQRSRSHRSKPNLFVSGLYLQFEFAYDDEMIYKAWCCLGEVPYCFSRSSVKFQEHMANKIVDFDPNWAFPVCNSRLNSLMAMKLCTKLEAALRRCPVIFQGHSSNLKVIQDKKIANLDPNWAFLDCNSSLNSQITMQPQIPTSIVVSNHKGIQ